MQSRGQDHAKIGAIMPLHIEDVRGSAKISTGPNRLLNTQIILEDENMLINEMSLGTRIVVAAIIISALAMGLGLLYTVLI